MADENIHVKITGSNRPSAIGGGTTPSSFASVTGAAGGGDARAIIRADAAIVTSQNSLADAIKQLRTAIAASATNSAERAALENRRRALMLQQRSLLSGGESVITGSAGAAERRSMTAMMPGSALHRAGRSLLGATRSAWSGDMGGTFGHIGNLAGGFGLRSMISRFGAGASGGAAEGAIAGAAGVEGVEAAGSLAALIGAPALTAAGIGVGLAGLGGLGYEAYKHRDTLKALPYALPTLLAARRYGPEEVDRQGEAYRAARLFGESGRSIVSATTGGRWAALGLSPSEATSALTTARETAGATSLSNRGAYRGMRSATLMGLTPQESAATVGGAARLGVDPSKWIDIVERGTTRANQNGQQSEINSALLMYLKRQSEISAVDETAAQKTVMRVASILGASGLPAFKGAGAVAGVAAIAAANQPGDLFGIGTTGSAITLMGKANILSAINADSTMSKLSSTDKIAMADRILTQGFTGPNAGMFLKSVVAPEIKMARSMGLYGTEAIEKQFHLPPGAKTDKLLYGKLLDAADAANVDDWNKYAPANLGAKKIAPMTSARATHLHGRALTAEAASGTYASAQYLEAAGLSKLRGYIRDPATASIIDKLTHELTPEASKLPGAVPTARPSYPLGPGEHPLGGAPVAGPGAVQVFADGFVGMIAAIEKLIAVEQGRANSGKPAYEPEPPMPTVTVHGTTRSPSGTPRVAPTPAH